MSVDLDKVIFSSSYNAFKNDSILTEGSIAFPTTLTSGQAAIVNIVLTLPEAPVFSEFISYFTELFDLSTFPNGTYGNPQWYPGVLSASNFIGVWVTAPAPRKGILQALINPIINGTTLTVQALVVNPYTDILTLAPLSIPFALTSYTLAN